MKLSTREKRVINALSVCPIMRENLDSIAGCSNEPELAAGQRRKDLSIPCERMKRYEKDGNASYPGQYSFTNEDKQIVRDWMKAER